MNTVLAAAAALSLTATLHAGGEGWTSDFEAAKAQAAKQGKDLLIDFTGSDWCGWCIKLKKEVFVHDAFKDGVKDKFVLVELDFPRDKSKISEETQAQNKKLGEKYAVRGYPTIMLTDAQGRPYAKTGYRAGGPEAYVTHLDELIATRVARDEAFAAAEKAEGVEKANALVEALQSIKVGDSLVAEFYGGVADRIKQADPQDESGFIKGLEQQKEIAAYKKELNALARQQDMDGALSLVDGMIAKGGWEKLETQRMLMTRAMILMGMKGHDAGLAQIDKALEFYPESPENEGIHKLRARIEAAKAKQEQQNAPKPAEKPDSE